MAGKKTNKKGGTVIRELPQTQAEPRTVAGEIPVFCAYDELVPIGKLVPNPRNPNQHPKEQIKLLAQIIQGQGWRAPITVSKRSGYIVRGHGRLQAAILLGTEVVPVDYQNYASEAEEWADLIADNRLSELSEIDNKLLMELIEEMDTGEIPVIYSGYTEDDLANIIAAMEGADDITDDGIDETPEMPKIPMSKPGDLWYLGPYKVICGSATDRATIERLMDGEKAHCVFTDPPYGVSYETQSGKFDMIKNDDLTGDNLVKDLLLPAFKNYAAFTIDEAAFYIWHASSTRDDFKYAMTSAGLIEDQYIIWVKNGAVLGHADYQWAHEPCFYASKAGYSPRFYGDRTQKTVWRATLRRKGALDTVLGNGLVITDGAGGKIFLADKPPKGKKIRYIRLPDDRSVFIYSEDKQSTVWEVSRETKTEHPTQKPVELVTRALENSTQPGELAIDFFGGSGSTMAGAELTGRKAYLVELDPVYVDVIVNRYVKMTGNITVMCERDGQRIPYARLKEENDRANEEALAAATKSEGGGDDGS